VREAEAPDTATYTFHPVERRGLLLGLGGRQLATMAAGAAAAIALASAHFRRAPAVSVAILVVAALASLWPVAGEPAVYWLQVAGGWARRRHALLDRTPLAGAGPRSRTVVAPVRGVRVVEATRAPGEGPMGVVLDRRRGVCASVLPVAGRGLSLLDAADQRNRLGSWGTLLAATARLGSPVCRIQWVEKTSPADPKGMTRTAEMVTGGSLALESYEMLVERDAASALDHQVFLVVAVRNRGGTRPAEVLRREVRLLRGQLRAADLDAGPPLPVAALGALIRTPMGSREHWDSLQADDCWHSTYWIAEWPGVQVGPEFLMPLLLSDACRAVSVTMAPIPPDRAVRQVESARTADVADEQLRARAGFLPTARRQRQAEGAIRREDELAQGHADYRYSGYVTVSAPSRSELEERRNAIEQAARQAMLSLRLLYGRQAESWLWTLPLGRGLS
jgi:hypothetical protein